MLEYNGLTTYTGIYFQVHDKVSSEITELKTEIEKDQKELLMLKKQELEKETLRNEQGLAAK